MFEPSLLVVAFIKDAQEAGYQPSVAELELLKIAEKNEKARVESRQFENLGQEKLG